MGTTPVLALNVWANENPKDETRSWDSNSGPHDCKDEAVPHDHGHHANLVKQANTNFTN